MNHTIYLYVFDTMSDWETGYVSAELNSGRYFKQEASRYSLRTVGCTKEPITTMGGIRILPDLDIGDMAVANTGLLLLPGGDTWLTPIHAPILDIARKYLERGIPVAAICGATLGLAQAGLLDNRFHTSNDPGFLKSVCPDYRGEDFYRQEPAVTDQNLITASGVAPLEFAYQVLKTLDVFAPQTLEAWYQLNLTHDPKHFYSLMESVHEGE